MAPNFLRKQLPVSDIQEIAPPPVPQRGERRPDNPFDRASADLAVQWDAMVSEVERSRDEIETTRGQLVYLSERVDSLTRELNAMRQFSDFEIDRLTKRADRAVEMNAGRRAKIEVIIKALRMVLDEELEPEQREPEQPPRAQPVPQPAEKPQQRATVKPLTELRRPAVVSQEEERDASEVRSIIDRMSPPKFVEENSNETAT